MNRASASGTNKSGDGDSQLKAERGQAGLAVMAAC
jgi:hypothetical protein